MARRFIKIPAPIAKVGDLVDVPNYRRSGAPLEEGIVKDISYKPKWGWSYAVGLDRETPKGNRLTLFVADRFHPPVFIWRAPRGESNG